MSGHKQEARIIAMITGLMAGLAATPVTAIDDLALNVAPGSEFVEPGDTVTVTLDVANLSTPINGVQALIQYDSAFMALADIVPTDLGLNAPDEGWVEVYISELWGDIDYTVVINGDPTIADGTVATLTFTVVDEGTTSVTFRANVPPYFTKLTGSDNSTIFPNRFGSGSIVSSCDDGLACTFDSLEGGFCQHPIEPEYTLCRASTDLCDPAELCDGVLGSCPADALELAGTVCRTSVGLCDLDETCDGVSAACTVDAVEPAATLCRASTGPCDVEETCDGVSGTCPTDTLEPVDTPCSDGDFCNGLETCDGLGDCRASTDPCAPLLCDEVNDVCLAPVHVAGLEVFYAGRFRFCAGGDRDGLVCVDDAGCTGTPPTPDGTCGAPQPDPSRSFLASGAGLFCVGGGSDGLGCIDDAGCAVCVDGINDGLPCSDAGDCPGGSCPRGTCASSKLDNITNYARGITGIRVLFDNIVDFAATPDAAFTFEWTDPTGTTFWPVTDAATAITVTATVPVDVTVVEIVLDDDHIRQRWLKVIIDSTQITSSGVELDGELVGNPVVLPSGDGTSGGDATFFVGSMPGDVSGDRKTRLFDVGQIRLEVNPAYPVPIENIYDVDKSGKVRLWDVGLTRVDLNPAFALPLISP